MSQNLDGLGMSWLHSFLLFDINKFMTEEHSAVVHSMADLAEPPKRRRTPSQYASQIDDFKNNLTARKPKTYRPPQIHYGYQEPLPQRDTKPLLCKLSNGRTYNVKIVIDPNQQKNGPKSEKKLPKKAETIATQKAEGHKHSDANLCLLDKLLSAVQNLQREQENDSRQNNKMARENPEVKTAKKLDRARLEKDKEEKWNKSYERYRALSEKLDTLEEKYIFLK